MDPTPVAKLATARRLARSGKARQIRQDAGLSLSDLAASVGVHLSTLQKWELGERSPRRAAAIRYADALAELLQITEPPQP